MPDRPLDGLDVVSGAEPDPLDLVDDRGRLGSGLGLAVLAGGYEGSVVAGDRDLDIVTGVGRDQLEAFSHRGLPFWVSTDVLWGKCRRTRAGIVAKLAPRPAR